MKPIRMIMALCALSLPAQALHAVPGGEIGTLDLGRYTCELPGDAASEAAIPQPDQDFRIIAASSYVSAGQRGAYLLTGDLVQFTSGPQKGRRYRQVSRGYLRLLDERDELLALRCIHASRY